MHVPSRLGPERLDVTVVTSRFAAEELVSPSRRRLVEVHRGIGRGQRELIELQRRELWSDLIVIRIDVRQIGKPICGSNRELRSIVEPGIEESPFAVHLKIRYKSVPVRN